MKPEEIHTFTIADDGKSITCLRCQRTSYNLNDVEQHYCGHCHVFHDDLTVEIPLTGSPTHNPNQPNT